MKKMLIHVLLMLMLCSLVLVLPVAAAENGLIAFRSFREDADIYVMNGDGTGQDRLTSDVRFEDYPAWSPDGKKIAFSCSGEIYVMNAYEFVPTQEWIKLTDNNMLYQDIEPAWNNHGTKIAFSSNRNGYFQIYEMNADGTEQIRVTNNPADDNHPSYSMDGTKIVFRSGEFTDTEIYVINTDGSGQTRLTDNQYFDSGPDWSPDDTKIAFNSIRNGNSDIYVMNSDGTGETRLTRSGHDSYPDWSPDGKKIVFESRRDGLSEEIYVMNSDGSGQTRLTDSLGGNFKPSWGPKMESVYITEISPNSAKAGDPSFTLVVSGRIFYPNSKVRWNGVNRPTTYISPFRLSAAISASDIQTPGIRNITIFNPVPWGGEPYGWISNKATFPVINKTRIEKIVFASNRDGNANIYVMNPDGTDQIRFTENTMEDIEPTLSPDGKKIAWVSDKTGNKEIYVINVDGTGQTPLTNNLSEDINPAWSPDGSEIAFSSKRGDGSTFDIYVMKADGTEKDVTRLTKNQDYDLAPCWSPDGSKIAFMSDRDGTLQIHVMNKDGSGQTRLNKNYQSGQDPAWSPDNLKIAFVSTSTAGHGEIYKMNFDGTTPIKLTNTIEGDRNPTWSPDGKKIAYDVYGVTNRDIYSMNADGTNQNRIVNNPANDYDPSWGYANTIIPPLPPGVLTAAFTNATPRSGTAPLIVSFTDQSEGTITTYAWNFGDGRTSTIQNPSHQYTTAGTYSVNLTVSGPSGSDSELKTNYITVNSAMVAPVAGFIGTPRTGTAPLTVNFADESTGSITSWDWDFGDGKSSSLQHPVHIYTSAGTYTVKLKVNGPKGSDDEIKSDYIKVSVPVKVRIVPTTLNTASKGKFVAFITLPSTYNAADVDAKSVVCEGATALKIMRSKAFPQTFAAIFNRDQLVNVKPEDKVKVTVTGSINKNGQKVGFSGSDIIKIISKKGAPKEAIDDVDTMTEEKVFSQFNPR